MSVGKTGEVRSGVLFISSTEEPGADTFVNMLLMRALDRSHFSVHLACPPPSGSPTFTDPYSRWIGDGVAVLRCRFGPSMTAGAGRAQRAWHAASGIATLLTLSRYIRRQGIGIVHSSDRPRDAAACRLLCRMSGARSVIHVHVKYGDWVSAPVRWGLRRADALIGVSKFVADSLLRAGFAAERTHAALNAIEVERWTAAGNGAAVRQEFGIPEGAPIVLCAARLFHWKGQGELMRTLPALRQEFPTVRLMIVGGDYKLTAGDTYLADLKALVYELGVEQHVIFTGHRTDMPALMAACDIFALPSFEEPFGLVFAEAMASKKPVIALESGGAPEVVDHGLSGLLSPPGDREALTANIAALLRNPQLRASMGAYGRRDVERRFTPARLAADVEKIYTRIWPECRRQERLIERHV
jgi:glycosyltransferase involved in cell wall biosynthesis